MALKIEGEHGFEQPPAVLWRALTEPEILARTLPGCESLERLGEHEFQGSLNIKVGPVQGRFQGHVTLTDVRPPEGYHLKLTGQGPAGFVEGEGDIHLTATEAGGSTLRYQLEAHVGGRIAGVGQRLLDSSAKVVTRQALEELGRQLPALVPSASAEGDGEAVPAPAPAPPTVSQAQFAARVTQGIVEDLIPARQRKWLAAGLALLVVAALVLGARACGS